MNTVRERQCVQGVQQQCKTVTDTVKDQQCKTTQEQVCQTVYDTKEETTYENVCQEIVTQKCEASYENKCEEVCETDCSGGALADESVGTGVVDTYGPPAVSILRNNLNTVSAQLQPRGSIFHQWFWVRFFLNLTYLGF